ncbi:glycosyltransferase family 4 protein [Acidobacteriota bacterium]
MNIPFGDYSLLFFITFGVALIGTCIAIPLAKRLKFVDRPGEHKSHSRITPLGGGVVIFFALLTILLFPSFRDTLTVVIVCAGGLLMLVGLIDDLIGVSAVTKFSILILLTIVLSQFGIMARTTNIFILDLLITIFWVTGVSSAFNAIDNMDGLATGVTAIAAGTFFIVACQTDQWSFGALSICLAGAAFGFLILNFPPARIFMGDAGSLLLGFVLAMLGVTGEWNYNPIIAAVIPILILGFPIFDLSFTVLTRHFRGVTGTIVAAIRHCDTDHISHRLIKLGLSPIRALLFMWFISLSFAISALTLRHALSVDAVLHLLQALCITLGLIFILLLPMASKKGPAENPAYNPESPHLRSNLKIRLGLVLAWSIFLGLLIFGTRLLNLSFH